MGVHFATQFRLILSVNQAIDYSDRLILNLLMLAMEVALQVLNSSTNVHYLTCVTF